MATINSRRDDVCDFHLGFWSVLAHHLEIVGRLTGCYVVNFYRDYTSTIFSILSLGYLWYEF